MESGEGIPRLCWLAWRESLGKRWRCLARAPMGLMGIVPRRERGRTERRWSEGARRGSVPARGFGRAVRLRFFLSLGDWFFTGGTEKNLRIFGVLFRGPWKKK